MSQAGPRPRPGREGGTAALALAGVLILAAAIFVAVVVGGTLRHPGLGGFLGAVFSGLFTALLFAATGAFGVLRFVAPALRETPEPAEPAAPLDGTLENTLAELERTRRITKAQIVGRATWRVPLGAAGGVGLWIFGQFGGGDPTGLIELAIYSVMGAGAGYFWASYTLSESYRRLYKERVLPLLAAQFGDLTYRPAVPDLAEIARHHLVEPFDDSTCEDEICGRYRGLALSIVEVRLTYGSGKEQRTVFDGLLTAVTLPRSLKGVTAVVPDQGPLGNWLGRSRIPGCEPVRVEDPAFEKAYQVFGTDQIAARALLTPAFMERFMRLAASGRFGRPVALVQDNRLLIALPRQGGRDLFEPPSYLQPAAGRAGLKALSDDIAAVLNAADAVIDLDQASRAQAQDRPGP